MIGRLRVLALFMLGGAVQAAPTPPPPEGYAGSQYIDAYGCVYTRDNAGWVPRQDGQGVTLCGFPPSMEARRTDPASDRVLPLNQAPAPDIETMLLDQLSRDLRPGEFVADRNVPSPTAEPAPLRRPDAVQAALQEAIDMAPALRQASGLSGTPELCARLGYRTNPRDFSGDARSGLCPGMNVVQTVATLTSGTRKQAQTTLPPVPQTTTTAAPAAPRATTVSDRRTPVPKPAKQVSAPEMIPPSARYVQVGAYAENGNAMIVLRALAARGYRTVQGRATDGSAPSKLIMAGPFSERQALIAALNDLRTNGYPKAIAR